LDYHGTNKEGSSQPEPSINKKITPASDRPEGSNGKKPPNWYCQLAPDKKIEFWSMLLVAISTIVMAVFTGFLWWTSSEQLTEIREGSRDTKIIAQAAKAQSDNTKTLAEAAVDQVAELKRLATATQDSLTLAKEQFSLRTRPYMWITSIDEPVLEIGEKPHANVQFANFGISPALNVLQQQHLIFGETATNLYNRKDSAEKVINGFFKKSPHPGGSVIFAVDKTNFRTAYSETVLTEADVEYIKSNDASIVVFGYFDYSDPTGNSYSTEYCRILLKTGATITCQIHNKIR